MSPPSKDESRIGREGPSPIHPSTGIGEAWHGHLNDGVGSESRAKQSQRIPVSEESDLMAPVDQFLTESQCTSGVPTPLPCERICEPSCSLTLRCEVVLDVAHDQGPLRAGSHRRMP